MEIMISLRPERTVVGVSFTDTADPIFGQAESYDHAVAIVIALMNNDPAIIDIFLHIEKAKLSGRLTEADTIITSALKSH